MNAEYAKIYSKLYRRLRFYLLPSFVASQRYPDPRKIVRRAEERIQVHLRPDAALFLASNLQLMVILPVAMRNRSDNAPSPAGLDQIMEEDCVSLLEDAKKRSEGSEISAGTLAEALGRQYRKLALAAENIWG